VARVVGAANRSSGRGGEEHGVQGRGPGPQEAPPPMGRRAECDSRGRSPAALRASDEQDAREPRTRSTRSTCVSTIGVPTKTQQALLRV